MGQKNHEPLGAKHLPGSHTRISFGKGAAKGKVAAWGPKGGRFRGAHRLLLCTWRTSCCEFPPTLPLKTSHSCPKIMRRSYVFQVQGGSTEILWRKIFLFGKCYNWSFFDALTDALLTFHRQTHVIDFTIRSRSWLSTITLNTYGRVAFSSHFWPPCLGVNPR